MKMWRSKLFLKVRLPSSSVRLKGSTMTCKHSLTMAATVLSSVMLKKSSHHACYRRDQSGLMLLPGSRLRLKENGPHYFHSMMALTRS